VPPDLGKALLRCGLPFGHGSSSPCRAYRRHTRRCIDFQRAAGSGPNVGLIASSKYPKWMWAFGRTAARGDKD
jgi:hypothetical protein